jgi:hypothetical protein
VIIMFWAISNGKGEIVGAFPFKGGKRKAHAYARQLTKAGNPHFVALEKSRDGLVPRPPSPLPESKWFCSSKRQRKPRLTMSDEDTLRAVATMQHEHGPDSLPVSKFYKELRKKDADIPTLYCGTTGEPPPIRPRNPKRGRKGAPTAPSVRPDWAAAKLDFGPIGRIEVREVVVGHAIGMTANGVDVWDASGDRI